MQKLLYKPFAIIAGLVASRVAGATFKKLWAFLAKETEMPQAMEQARGGPKSSRRRCSRAPSSAV